LAKYNSLIIIMPPFEEERTHCFAHVGRSVGVVGVKVKVTWSQAKTLSDQ